MLTINPLDLEPRIFYSYLTGTVAPRPIALVSSIDNAGNVNLSPFSFFNIMGINPPLLVFAPNNRSRDNSKKDTALNISEVHEVVINMVDNSMVQQMSLSSVEYPKGINEFIKSGFTPEPSLLIRPPRVKESPAQFECKVLEVREIGTMNLFICQIIMAHFADNIIGENGRIDQRKTDWVARLGADWYARVNEPALFEVEKPNTKIGIGYDAIPEQIRLSKILTGNHLGQLGNTEVLPLPEEIEAYRQTPAIQKFFEAAAGDIAALTDFLHHEAQRLLSLNKVKEAWLVLLQNLNPVDQ
ncbi:flavin reductase family protein [Emticicia sp. 21SJ11W-3]|uniref:flavin reductase family protein n=1 Tax=Emticicia sp. 21SJ11W-3 TaxID=2916755 RepID=UPI0020A0E6A7|nr:flavin reductase family protein [Emticicia sp. 21SJ11W-3]UTA69821.1 flavin reductase family protein [Emticicia sp. 21SJ11W-3]